MKIYESKKLPTGTISHGFFGRKGGVSEGIYKSLNCALGSDDEQENVLENRARVAEEIGADELLGVYQKHTQRAVYVDDAYGSDSSRPEADAMVTDIAGKALSILTADCTPVCFHGVKSDGKDIIGIAHAGWRGALGGVLDSTVNLMREKGAELENIKAVIGPTINQKSYEVGDDFYDQFIERDQESMDFFKEGKLGKKHFDLPGYCAYRLRRLGVDYTEISDIDTYTNEEICFSYRRSTHRAEPDYARQISVIMIKP